MNKDMERNTIIFKKLIKLINSDKKIREIIFIWN